MHLYILNYHKSRDIFVSYGKISYLHNTDIFYQGNIKENTKEYFSVSPIILTNNQKLLGIHKKNSKKYNKGNLLIYCNILILINKYILILYIIKLYN